MRIKDFEFDWLICPNCGNDDISQVCVDNYRELYCVNCQYHLRETFVNIYIIKKEKEIPTEKETVCIQA